jgi:serine/threonine-protein kinase
MPDQISSYRLEGEIARGGMGIVYRGVHTVFEEVVAIKAIFPELTVNPELRERFVNEAKIQRRLQHPNIVQIREFLIEQGKFYIVMEYVEGETLAERLKRSQAPMPINEAMEIFRQALAGLGHAHSQGVIHRDIKPSNFMLTRGGVTKLTDFGIARAVGAGQLTRSGIVLGTPAYMSPEQIQGLKVDARADIYSMGITLYEMLAGRVPFERAKDSENDFAVLAAHIDEQPPPPSRFAPSIAPFVESAILKALAKQREERFSSCEEFGAALSPPVLPKTRVAVAASPPAAPQLKAVQPAAKAPTEEPSPPKPREFQKSTHAGLWRVAGPMAVLLAAGSFWFYRTQREKAPANISAPVQQAPTSAPSTEVGSAQKSTPPAERESKPTTPSSAPPGKEANIRQKEKGKAGSPAVSQRPGAQVAQPRKPSPEELAAQVRELLGQAKTAMDGGKYDDAIAGYRKALRLDPNNSAAREGLARAQKAKAAEDALR